MHYQCIISTSSVHHPCIVSASSAHHWRIIRASSGHHQRIIGTLSVHHQYIIRASSAHHQRIISASSAHHQRIISVSRNMKCPPSRGPLRVLHSLLCLVYALFSVKFPGLKLRCHTKNDIYEVSQPNNQLIYHLINQPYTLHSPVPTKYQAIRLGQTSLALPGPNHLCPLNDLD